MVYILNAEHPHDMSTVLGNSLAIFLSFVILLYIINKFAAGPILSIIEKREQHIHKQLNDVEETLNSVKADEKAAKDVLKNAQAQANDIVIRAKSSALQLREDMLKQANEEVAQLKENARVALEKERLEMLSELQAQVGDMSVALAQKIIHRELTVADHQRLIDDFIEGLDN